MWRCAEKILDKFGFAPKLSPEFCSGLKSRRRKAQRQFSRGVAYRRKLKGFEAAEVRGSHEAGTGFDKVGFGSGDAL